MSKKRIIKSDDDTVLWQRVITEVKPLKSTVEFVEFAEFVEVVVHFFIC